MSLTPGYSREQHGVYVEALADAIENRPKVKNIALTGPYGTGKSSALEKISELYPTRVVQLSLSTVGDKPDEPEPSASPTPGTSANPASTTTTNRIQKEIVKQILYSLDPAETRGSRFRRITRFRIAEPTLFAFAIGVAVVAVLFLSGLDKPLVAGVGNDLLPQVLAHAVLVLLIAAILVTILWFTHNRLFLEKVAAGAATVTLSPQSTSYFDQYLDEIVYFFEVSGRDIVVFEDIDRFENIHIFETLRALNTLLNGSHQVANRAGDSRGFKQFFGRPTTGRPPVKFIYALRDSVFDKLLQADSETTDEAKEQGHADQFSRTKFFDVVIPLVPFITHHNARDLMSKTMGDRVARPLVDVAARHVADMRLILSISNEFDIFKRRLLDEVEDQKKMPGLNADLLFAMVLYKNMHMGDFEAIRFGTSKLDELHDAWRELVRVNIDDRSEQVLKETTFLRSHDFIEERSRHLGKRLKEVAAFHGRLARRGGSQLFQVGGAWVPLERLEEKDFWIDIIANQRELYVDAASGTNSHTYWVPFGDLPTFLNEKIDLAEWDLEERSAIQGRCENAQADVAFLRHHEWQEIFNRPEFTLGSDSFQDLAKQILQSPLAYDLVANGFINEYFALYISIYYGEHLRPNALNYIVHYIDKGHSDYTAQLTPEDVEAILAEKGETILSDRSMYNISVVDFLLSQSPSRADPLMRQIASWGEPERKFVGKYLELSTGEKTRFVEDLLGRLPGFFTYLATEAPVDAGAPSALFDAALSSWMDGLTYELGDPVREYIDAHWTEFAAITESARQTDAPRAIDLITRTGTKIPSVTLLSPAARAAVANTGAYSMTEENLLALAGAPDIALDVLRSNSEPVFGQAVARAPEYLAAVSACEHEQPTIHSPAAFAEIIEAVATSSSPALGEIIRRSADDCRIDDLTSAPEAAFGDLVFDLRVPPTFANITFYMDATGQIDTNLATLLGHSGKVSEIEGASEPARAKLAAAILDARGPLPSQCLRANLAASLELSDVLPATGITPESGDLIGLLIERGIIADDRSAFSDRLMIDWPTREFAISKSSHFSEFFDPMVLPGSQLPQLFGSALVPASVKLAVIGHLPAYAAAAPRGLGPIADFALEEGIALNHAQLDVLQRGGAGSARLIGLIARSQGLPFEEMRSLLNAMGGDYATITQPGTRQASLPDDDAHRSVLERLKEAGVVSSYSSNNWSGMLRVHLKRP
ncbi:YobI family P-loop NTPase [Arthrobacter alkaliphilus]